MPGATFTQNLPASSVWLPVANAFSTFSGLPENGVSLHPDPRTCWSGRPCPCGVRSQRGRRPGTVGRPSPCRKCRTCRPSRVAQVSSAPQRRGGRVGVGWGGVGAGGGQGGGPGGRAGDRGTEPYPLVTMSGAMTATPSSTVTVTGAKARWGAVASIVRTPARSLRSTYALFRDATRCAAPPRHAQTGRGQPGPLPSGRGGWELYPAGSATAVATTRCSWSLHVMRALMTAIPMRPRLTLPNTVLLWSATNGGAWTDSSYVQDGNQKQKKKTWTGRVSAMRACACALGGATDRRPRRRWRWAGPSQRRQSC